MASAEANYATELAAAEQRLILLKRKAVARAKARGDTVPESQRDTVGDGANGAAATDRSAAANGANEGPPPPSELQRLVAGYLLEASGAVPMDSHKIHRELSKPEGKGKAYDAALGTGGGVPALEAALKTMGAGELAALELEDFEVAGKQRVMVLDVTRARLVSMVGGQEPSKAAPVSLPPPPMVAMPDSVPFRGGPFPPPASPAVPPGGPMLPGPPPFNGPAMHPGQFREEFIPASLPRPPVLGSRAMAAPPPPQPLSALAKVDLEAILGHKSIGDRKKTEKGEELLELLQKPTAKENATVEKFRMGGTAVKEYCPQLTKEDCCRVNGSPEACTRLHFRRLTFPWTDPGLGNCNYLDTCRHMHNCKFVHYELDTADVSAAAGRNGKGAATRPSQRDGPPVPTYLQALEEPQWINCDVRKFDMSVLGKFGVIMTDPPWEIHQDLPYGTMADDEMRKLNIGCLQDDGVIFLWVTGRAMELGRECLEIWGYKRVDELIWVKTNQLQRLIRTGRTGHWLNHSKEHCLVGYKGNPQLNRCVDTDVVVAEVRETSRKPDELYSLLERLSPGTRKLEIFARQHNCQPGWVGLGNQLDDSNIKDPELLQRYNTVYGPGLKDPLHP